METGEMSKSDLVETLERYVFDLGSRPYYAYLTRIVDFLDSETERHNQDFDELKQEIESGETEVPDNLRQDAYLILDHHGSMRSDIHEFKNILFSSFFVTIYFYLESELTSHCKSLEKKKQEKLSSSNTAGDVLERVKTCLTKVHHIDFSFGDSQEWEEIQDYKRLRNCIVHNQGRLDENLKKGQQEKLEEFIDSSTKLRLENTWCILDKEFCEEALDTIKEFLYLVISAKPKAL